MNTQNDFKELGLSPKILETIRKKGFKNPSEIQSRIIPLVFEDKYDIIGISQTGSGKTGSFALPIIDRLNEKGNFIKVIILTPTRELAIQVKNEVGEFIGDKKLKTISVYGGDSIKKQIGLLRRGVDIIVGTPGRILDLIDRKCLKLENIKYFVLDEADEMLKMGFLEPIEKIFNKTPKDKRVLLFSATMPDKIKQLSKKYMKNQKIIEVKKDNKEIENIEQSYYILKPYEKLSILLKVLDNSKFFYGIIFCQRKVDVDNLTKKLKMKRKNVECIHGDIVQSKRERILKSFRKQKIDILIATDVASRGIDIKDLSHVINYSMPIEIDSYIHRIGRTARAGKKGKAISFITIKEHHLIKKIEKVTKSNIKKENFLSDRTREVKLEKKSPNSFYKEKGLKFKKDIKKFSR